MATLDDLAAAVPDSASDVESLADRLDYDFDAAIEFVRDNVRYEPYQGVLRGPDGVASARRGNAWDQALLLAALINTMGGEAQIVVGRLSRVDTSRLLASSFDSTSQNDNEADLEKLIQIVAQYDQQTAALVEQRLGRWQEESTSSTLVAETAAISDSLLSLLDRANVHVADSTDVDALIRAMSDDYAWVRWREGSSSRWVDLHPAFADAPRAQPDPERFIAGEVPVEFQHRIAFQIHIERVTGAGALEKIAVMDRFERPTAQLFKNQLALGMGPMSPEVGADARFIVPFLDDGIAPGGQAVTSLGLTAEASDVSGASAALFETLSSRLGHALGTLDAATGGDEENAPRLTGVLLQIEILAPRSKPVLIERRLADLRNNPSENPLASAAFGLVVDIDVGPEDSAKITHRLIEHEKALIAAVPVLYALAREAISLDEARATREFRALNHSIWPAFDLIAAELLARPSANQITFRPGALVAARRTFHDPEKGMVTTSDILSNPVTVLQRHEDGRITAIPAAAVFQGVRETLLESQLVRSNRRWSNRSPKYVVANLTSFSSDETISRWPRTARELAEADLARGYVLGITDEAEPHWWRVDPGSGQTLGMGTFGGQEIAEYLAMTGAAALSTYLFYRSVQSCDETYADNRRMADCCIVGNLLATYGTAALGGALSLPSGPAQAYLLHPFAASAGYITASLSFEMSYNLAIGAAAERPIRNVCRAYLGS